MSLDQTSFRFDGVLPDLAAVRSEAERRLGSASGIASITTEGKTVVAQSMLDPFTHPVVCAVLEEMGGKPLSARDGSPTTLGIPDWARRPISELGFFGRMKIQLAWWSTSFAKKAASST